MSAALSAAQKTAAEACAKRAPILPLRNYKKSLSFLAVKSLFHNFE